MDKSNTFLYDLKGVMFGLQVGGMLPIYDVLSSYEIGMPSKRKRFLSYAIQCILYASVVYELYTVSTYGVTQLFYSYNEIDNVNNQLEMFLGVITFIAVLFFSSKHAHLFLNVVNDIMRVAKELEQHNGIVVMAHSVLSFAHISTGVICALQLYIGILKIVAVQKTLLMSTCIQLTMYGLHNVLAFIYLVLVSALLHLISLLFNTLNDIMWGYTYRQQPSLQAMDMFSSDCLLVFRVHNKLLYILRLVEDFCCPVLFMYMAYAFFAITSNTHSIIIQITARHSMSYIMFQLSFTVVIVHIMTLALLAHCAHKATLKANTMSKIFAKIYIKSDEKSTHRSYMRRIFKIWFKPNLVILLVESHVNKKLSQVDKFLMKGLNRPAQFTVYGFFNVDASILFKIFSAVTTFLVVMIQFRQMKEY